MTTSTGEPLPDGETEENVEAEDPATEAADATDDKALSFKNKMGDLLRGPMKAADAAVAGVVAAKDGFVDFLTANDKGATRVAEAAARASAHLGEDLDRGDLTPDERMQRHEAEERLVKEISDNEKRVRKSNERGLSVVAVVALAAITVVGGAAAIVSKENKA